jgi:hypothetical protein
VPGEAAAAPAERDQGRQALSDLITIDIDQEKQAVDRLYAAWQEALVDKQKAIADAVASHASPGNNYWLPEQKAKAKWIVAANFVEMLEAARR